MPKLKQLSGKDIIKILDRFVLCPNQLIQFFPKSQLIIKIREVVIIDRCGYENTTGSSLLGMVR
jgi:hypothetical protein